MSENFKVSLDYKDQDGHVEYDAVSKGITVVFANEVARRIVEEYLGCQQVMNVAQTLTEFKEVTINPCDSLENFKMALTKMWGSTGVLVQWSKPV